ncbi:MAG: transaldolase [Omnitrophica WOR_2 bacterium RIFCSPLOWO2_12_FULL_50_9]|nr:MAG: transaldolase [Omnitrophica WOR_2 bacterium RIFCSPHIGHO2_02_FULL_50_17]OGX40361.1 MAG: transaldolase [Omnitrophica WOR_2 bacterium RIFCSPLOWO2_12_FULL_50_9]
MQPTTIQQLADYGQSIWLDYISRSLLESGKLKNLIAQGLRGMTSNPSIFNQVISSGRDYDERIIRLKAQGKSTFEIYDALTIADIQDAADFFQGVYEKTKGLDGYVSLEINPQIAHRVDEQVKEGIRLCTAVQRPNLMIKVPATKEGLTVAEELIAYGINVNVTLIFSLQQYEGAVKAYFKGLNRLTQHQGDLTKLRSVASVFVSRVDTTVDELLDERLADVSDSIQKEKLQSLKGKAAVANCRAIFEKYRELFGGGAFKVLKEKGADIQRVLWGSTSTKNPQYSDIKYVTELIARPTVNTIPEKTLHAFLDHGCIQEAFTYPASQSKDLLAQLKNLGIDADRICQDLLHDGVVAFEDAFQALLASIEKKAAQLCAP